MPNAAKPGHEPLPTHPEVAPEATFDVSEASETAARRLSGGPAPNARFGEHLQSTTPQALGPSGPKRRSSADSGNDAEASDRAGSKFDLAGAPSSAPPEFARAAAAGTSETLGRIASLSRAAQPGAPHYARAPEARRDQVAAPGATARAAGLAPRAAPPRSALARHPTRSAVFTKRPGWPKAGRRGA
jgi:hypothetical protein